MKKLILLLLFLSSPIFAIESFNLSCTKKTNPQFIAKFDIYFISFKRATYSLKTISMQAKERIHRNDPIEELDIIEVKKQRSELVFDDIIEVNRELFPERKYFRFLMDKKGVANLLVAEEEEEVALQQSAGSLQIYSCNFLD